MLSSRAPGRVEFVEVRKPRKKPPTWVGASQRARSSLSTLRPPKLPSNLAQDLVDFTDPDDGRQPRDGRQEYPRGYNPEFAAGGELQGDEAWHDPSEYRREITPPPPRGPQPTDLEGGLEMAHQTAATSVLFTEISDDLFGFVNASSCVGVHQKGEKLLSTQLFELFAVL